MTKEEYAALQEIVTLRERKIDAYHDSINKLRKLNIEARKEIDKYWDDKLSNYKKRK